MERNIRADLNMVYSLGKLLLYFYVSKHFVVIFALEVWFSCFMDLFVTIFCGLQNTHYSRRTYV